MSAWRRAEATAAEASLRHEAVFYRGDRGFIEALLPFAREAIAWEEPILAVLPRRRCELLRDALADDAGAVMFADMDEVGANPARLIPAWQAFRDEYGLPHRRICGIGEPVHPGRDAAGVVECLRHEALINVVLADGPPFWLVCPYDVSVLDDEMVTEAHATHPYVLSDGVHATSNSYRPATMAGAFLHDPLPAPGVGSPAEVSFGNGHRDVATLRPMVAAAAREHGLGRSDTDALVLAVNEVTTNSVRHGGGSGVLRIWTHGDRVVCEVEDRGCIDDPAAGRVVPDLTLGGGRGLWLANQLCDLVQIRCYDGRGIVRLHLGAAVDN